jgi:DNA-directed RNA polymerase subunit L
MKVNVQKRTDSEMKLEVEGAGHSLLNLLQKILLEDENIEMAGYHVPHPLIDKGVLYIHTKGNQTPDAAVAEATKKVLDLSKDFHDSFKKANKEWKQK